MVHMCLGLKLIRHMWEASLPDVGLSKTVRHSQSGQYLLIGDWTSNPPILIFLGFVL